MKVHTISLIHALLLIVISTWGYFDSTKQSLTAFIPAVIGLGLLACYPGLKKENKLIAHIAVALTVLILAGLFRPLTGSLEKGNTMATIRVSTMLFATAVALIFFVKSFVDARKNRG